MGRSPPAMKIPVPHFGMNTLSETEEVNQPTNKLEPRKGPEEYIQTGEDLKRSAFSISTVTAPIESTRNDAGRTDRDATLVDNCENHTVQVSTTKDTTADEATKKDNEPLKEPECAESENAEVSRPSVPFSENVPHGGGDTTGRDDASDHTLGTTPIEERVDNKGSVEDDGDEPYMPPEEEEEQEEGLVDNEGSGDDDGDEPYVPPAEVEEQEEELVTDDVTPRVRRRKKTP